MPAERKVVINIDDVGMCHGANVAYLKLKRAGAVDSGSVMVPCPWFLEIAEEGAKDASLNLGVHITLTSEKKYYRSRTLTKANSTATKKAFAAISSTTRKTWSRANPGMEAQF